MQHTGNVNSCGWRAEQHDDTIYITTIHGDTTTLTYCDAEHAERKFGHLVSMYVNFGLEWIEAHLKEASTA